MSSVIEKAEKAADSFGDHIDSVAKGTPGHPAPVKKDSELEADYKKVKKEAKSLLSQLISHVKSVTYTIANTISTQTSNAYSVTYTKFNENPFIYTNLLVGIAGYATYALNSNSIYITRLKYNEKYQYIAAGVLTGAVVLDSLFYKYLKDNRKNI